MGYAAYLPIDIGPASNAAGFSIDPALLQAPATLTDAHEQLEPEAWGAHQVGSPSGPTAANAMASQAEPGGGEIAQAPTAEGVISSRTHWRCRCGVWNLNKPGVQRCEECGLMEYLSRMYHPSLQPR
jgi:hypothetical protein